jgi:hypothetical protein
LSVRQGHALDLAESSSKVNRLGDLVDEVDKELQRRPGDQRGALVTLFSHPNDWVRFNAATSLIAIARAEARQVIQTIADSKVYPQALHAGMYLSTYDGEMSKLLRK